MSAANWSVVNSEFLICSSILEYFIFLNLFRLYSTSAEGLQDTRSYSLLKMLSLDSMFEKLQTGEKIHDAARMI